ncbi:MAG: adenine deaminase [Bacteroidetes bacterium]|nr:MAG: adenine deaminase [Bacteroidota bacterium]
MESKKYFSGKIVDVVNNRVYEGKIEITGNTITSISEGKAETDQYIIPGLIDAHIHVESSMLLPSEFARLAVVHGTVATVSDPHEIANILGIDGVKFMIRNGNKTPFKFFFGAPSCVPATVFETSGATLGVDAMKELMKMDEIKYMSEMMNFPGVLYNDKEVMAKLAVAKKTGKPVDGHAPGVLGEDAKKYSEAGISTDHECFTMAEALDKIKYGMKVQIREGSAAKNFETLAPLMKGHSNNIMLCSDDRHPNDLMAGHMNEIVKRAIEKGYDPVEVLKVCTFNPIKHYGLNVGLLQVGDRADFAIIDNLKDFNILKTFIDGRLVAENGKTLIQSVKESTPNQFNVEKIKAEDIAGKANGKHIKVLKALEGQLITKTMVEKPKLSGQYAISDVDRDILKIVVVNRYKKAEPAIAFVNNFGFKRGAIASSIAHDSHNIIAVGTTDEDITKAINMVIETKGGVSVVDGKNEMLLPLPVAGIMSDKDGFEVARKYDDLDKAAKALGSTLNAPFMTLSFMALLVIPELKLSDKGLFDGMKFEFTSLFVK